MTIKRILPRSEAELQEKVNAMSQESHSTNEPVADKTPKGLTNETVRATQENVVQDIKFPDIDLQSPKSVGEQFMSTLTEEQLAQIDWSKVNETTMLFTDAIVARDLKLPSYLNARPKDPAMEFRWVNRKFNGEGGNRYERMIAMGFINTRPEDCLEGSLDFNRVKTEGNAIICDDVILMKISKYMLYGMYKSNLIKANRTFMKGNVHKEAKDAGIAEMRRNLQAAGIPQSAYKGKLSMFIPDKTPLDPSSTDI